MAKKGKKAKITLETLINLDVRKKNNFKMLIKGLSRISWLTKYNQDEITNNVLESLYRHVAKKYNIAIGYVYNTNDESWAFMIKNDKNQWVKTVYALTLFEGLAKTILVQYAVITRGEKFMLKK